MAEQSVANRSSKVFIPRITEANTITREQIELAFKAIEPLEGIYWGSMIDYEVSMFKATYSDSWNKFKLNFIANEASRAIESRRAHEDNESTEINEPGRTNETNESMSANETNATKALRKKIFLWRVTSFNEYMNEVTNRNKKRIELENKKTAQDYQPYTPESFVYNYLMQEILTDKDKEKYARRVQLAVGETPLISLQFPKDKLPFRFFIITEEPGWWSGKIDEYKGYGVSMDKEKNIYSFNSLKPVNDIKEFMIRSGFIQTFSNDSNKIIDLIYFNDYFRVRTYYNTPAYIKNGIAKESITCVNHKDLLYENLRAKYPDNIHDFMASSIIVNEANMDPYLTRDGLRKNLVAIYSQYDDAITPNEIYIVRPVAYKADFRFRAAIGSEILILNAMHEGDFNSKIAKIKELLKSRYETIIISKFIETKLINGYTFHLRAFTIVSVTKLKKQYINPKDGSLTEEKKNKYFMHGFLSHKVAFRVSSKPTSTTTREELVNYDAEINTHGSNSMYQIFPDDIIGVKKTGTQNNIFTDEEIQSYLTQMGEIMNKVFSVLKKDIQIYHETESGFTEFGFDFMIGANGKVYLPEVNQEGGFYSYVDRTQINQAKYLTLNNSIQSMMVKGILNPVLFSGEYYKNNPKYDNFVQIIISYNLYNEPERKRKPIKEEEPNRSESVRSGSLKKSRSNVPNWRFPQQRAGNRKFTKKLIR